MSDKLFRGIIESWIKIGDFVYGTVNGTDMRTSKVVSEHTVDGVRVVETMNSIYTLGKEMKPNGN